ncbi:MAG TPA: hypothetical protein VE033_08055, partial [Acetobacteraceae bacterium]|nr:hypothetical protein [Acetobacteraceae bacterium]
PARDEGLHHLGEQPVADPVTLLIRSTRPVAQEWLMRAKRCSMPCSAHRMANMWVMKRAVGPEA